MKKRILSLILCFVFVFGCCSTVMAESDYISVWLAEEYNYAAYYDATCDDLYGEGFTGIYLGHNVTHTYAYVLLQVYVVSNDYVMNPDDEEIYSDIHFYRAAEGMETSYGDAVTTAEAYVPVTEEGYQVYFIETHHYCEVERYNDFYSDTDSILVVRDIF